MNAHENEGQSYCKITHAEPWQWEVLAKAFLPECQGKGYGCHLFKRTLDHFDEQGFESPMILASTRRSAKLYGPLLGFHIHKEVFAPGVDAIPAGVFMKRNEPGV